MKSLAITILGLLGFIGHGYVYLYTAHPVPLFAALAYGLVTVVYWIGIWYIGPIPK